LEIENRNKLRAKERKNPGRFTIPRVLLLFCLRQPQVFLKKLEQLIDDTLLLYSAVADAEAQHWRQDFIYIRSGSL